MSDGRRSESAQSWPRSEQRGCLSLMSSAECERGHKDGPWLFWRQQDDCLDILPNVILCHSQERTVDDTGRLSISEDCRTVFSYGPNPGENFVWKGDLLSQIHLADGSRYEFNEISGQWFHVTETEQGEQRRRQSGHDATFNLGYVDVTVSLDGAVTVDRLRSEFQRVWSAFNSDNMVDVPFNAEQKQQILQMLRDNEGIVPQAYKDSKQIWTIGIGTNMEAPKAKELLTKVGADYDLLMRTRQDADRPFLTVQQTEELLRIATIKAVFEARRLYPGFDRLPPEARTAVLDMTFNMGYDTLSTFKRFNALVNSGEFRRAAGELKFSQYRKQVGDRADRNIELLIKAQQQ